MLNPSASGTAVQKNDYAEIDYSNAKDGYVMGLSSAPAFSMISWALGMMAESSE